MTPTTSNPTTSTAALYAASTLQAAQANVNAAVAQQVADLNAQNKGIFQTAFNNWLINWTAARITDKSTAPTPPLAFVVAFFVDSTSGKGAVGSPYGDAPVEWAYPAIGTDPVCPMPAIPDVPPAQVHPVITGNDRLQNVPPGDTMPVGSIIPAPDGSRWEKMASQTPFGVATYYARIA